MDEDAGSAARDDGASGERTGGDAENPRNSTLHGRVVETAGGSDGDDGSPVDSEDEPSERPEGSVAGTFAPDIPIKPEVVDPTNAAFVALGAYLALLALAAVLVPRGRLTVTTLAWLTLGFLAVTGLAYAFFAGSVTDPPADNPDT